jgi:hypothetical protein
MAEALGVLAVPRTHTYIYTHTTQRCSFQPDSLITILITFLVETARRARQLMLAFALAMACSATAKETHLPPPPVVLTVS